MTIYKKLVRDHIPNIIAGNGKSCEFNILEQDLFIVELKKKLKEEVAEYLAAMNDNDAVEELADILEVIHALAETHHKSYNEIEFVRQKKFDERGGFKNKYFLIKSSG
ncbi:putative house-cleaning noncanonical NTP pyrophosphatase (MazG superfamily) [Cytobacillus horneckiae]|uniref:Phosphoribosyl-ATP pyrophosphohydrolase n=1 Tax=Cytobacillus horneckiae TaxID=549687 RepID=A0A2N0Z9W7_9BACI|nr:nucleoside triphosphate pyrophosphohydrolase [Cytobacillus horneckiae]MBN6886500.1 nucleoside triphosphate pyrophosphohydrolase [Cytobacillus horneckiae]MCM3176739.1 nucleoside triphosphate pyrophosphohydrolase [Cytobacillus horneckiae]MEC1157639.1 nucleoside triphosphate pyrophosphohydrolase [Cytobacillus horneckiae]MED2939692.1 nucleoside triphosphate pyrophosphohydrolase [Cytobacillus horneckiae]PKG26301.1 phosphoribosyl-ATP pyrophosphohydrolase [Cytobacillus horneckiae]